MGQRTFETGSLYLVLAEKWFALPAANEMLSLSALFAGKYREVGQWDVGILEEAATDPLESGRLVCGDGTCVWPYTYQVLPAPLTGIDMYYRGGAYSTVISDLQSYAAPNVVFTSLDLEPAENAYAVSWVKTAQTGGFDYRVDPISPVGTGQQARIQAQAALDGTESRVVTAVSFDKSGNALLISYGWTGDTTTIYETQTTIVPPGGAVGTNVLSAATTMASQGYIISAFGGNDTDGYILVGMRVQGDNLPRPIEDYYTDQQPYFTTVVYLREYGATTVVNEQ